MQEFNETGELQFMRFTAWDRFKGAIWSLWWYIRHAKKR